MLRLRTKLYLMATGAYGVCALLGAVCGVLNILGFAFVMTAFCWWMSQKLLEEDAEILLSKLEGK
jgi:hypothetical protein